MLGKLLKYDFKSTFFYYLLVYAAVLGTSVLARLSVSAADFDSPFQNNVLMGMTTVGAIVLYTGACAASMVLVLFFIAMRFYKNLLGNEGYLSFTLPVTENAHLLSKVLSGVLYLLLTYAVLLLSGFIISAGTGLWGSPFGNVLERFIRNSRLHHPAVGILYLLKSAALLFQTVLIVYFSICVGQLAARHRVLGAIGIYLGVNLVLGMVTVLGSAVFLRLLEGETGTTLYYGVTYLAEFLFRILVCIGCYAGSYCLLKYRLNLE